MPHSSRSEAVMFLDEQATRPVQWLWAGRMPVGKATLLVGDPDAGKSALALDLAARVTRGEAMPLDDRRATPGRVLLLSADDEVGDTVRPRLERAGAELSRVAVLPSFVNQPCGGRRLLSLWKESERLREALEEVPDCRLIVIDPISAYLGGADGNNNVSVRQVLQGLAELAREQGAALLLISHPRKRESATAMYRALGALAFTAVARSVLMLVDDPAVSGRRLLLPLKSTLQAAEGGCAFRIEEGRVEWESEAIPYTAAELQDLARTGAITADPRREAVEWLQEELSSGPVASDEIQRRAKERQIPKRILWEAKKAAGVQARRERGHWHWELPATAAAEQRVPWDAGGLGMAGGMPLLPPGEAGRKLMAAWAREDALRLRQRGE